MRPDLNKVLCEHERYRSKDRYKNYRHLKNFNSGDPELLPSREGMKKRYGYNVKEFSENLNALYGLVRKYAGKKWDDFYSDLCKNFDKRSVINQHILQHLDWYVERNIIIGEDGKLYATHSYGSDLIEHSSCDYYVDPRDGIIKKNKSKSHKARMKEQEENRKREEAKVFRQLDADNVLRFIDGVWYHFEMKDIPEAKIVYTKPLGTDEFNVTPSWSNKQKVVKTWDELNQDERERLGQRKITGTVKDLFLNRVVYRYKNRVHAYMSIGELPALKNKYHATKQTASHKLLKKAGLI